MLLTYLLKANLLLALFYLFSLLMRRDTLFAWRRGTLLAFVGIALLAPALPSMHGWAIGQLSEPVVEGLRAEVWLPMLTVGAGQTAAAATPVLSFLQGLLIVYAAGVLLLMCRIVIQLTGIGRLARRCRPAIIGQTRIRLLPEGEAPFSFFRLIFVCPTGHTAEALEEILIHEQTHVRQWHSVDVMITELMCAICWFNPAAWLLKREVKNNLEYLADRRVLDNGYNPRSYQYHLLGLADHKAAANIYNNFNVSPLKQRIKMMNKRRTSYFGRIKYLLFIPTAVLLGTACTNSNQEAPKAEQQSVGTNVPATAENTDALPTATAEQTIVDMAEVPPQYPGGTKEMMNFLAQNIQYPEKAKADKLEGRVICQFIVTADGTVNDVKVVRGISPELDAEAVRVIRLMPKWTPGKQDGEAVNVRYTIPISFKLQ